MSLQAIKYTRGSLELLDQRLLPFETIYLPVPDPQTAWTHIRDMVVRGAPAIGVTGALALAVDLVRNQDSGAKFSSVDQAVKHIGDTLDYLVTSRPTAVNLADSAIKLKAVAAQAAQEPGITPVGLTEKVVAAAETWMEDDVAANKAMGAYGAEALLAAATARGRGTGGRLRVLTHCNTGSLATAGFGTALGVIRALQQQGRLEHAFCTETRPYNQGARLTAFELAYDKLPATLICDSAAAALMAQGQVDAVVVGADRVVANGDTANKIGTYSLSVVCAHHNIPFFIAAPTTTLDPNLPDGGHIVIEQRTSEEITHFRGQRVVTEGIQVWNPSFDVAPAKLIEGIITEKGMVPKAGDAFQVGPFMAGLGLWTPPAGQQQADGSAAPAGPAGFRALDCEGVRHYVAAKPGLAALVGPTTSIESWSVREVGDGNINFVYIVEGPSGALCVKQALPFVRCVGQSWPLTQDRVRIEAEALMAEAAVCPAHTPKVHLYDPAMCIVAMQYLPPPFIILRKGIIQGSVYPHLASHLASFLATTLFHTSLLALDSKEFRSRVHSFSNPEMCRLTEQVIFTEPYMEAANNKWTSPQLDEDVIALRSDVEAKAAISALKQKFVQSTEALLHGDLHTGSIMATPSETYVIDPEFAYYGPMAFDIGKVVANLLLAGASTYGHEAAAGAESREAQRAWLLESISSLWNQFQAKFLDLWNQQGRDGSAGDLIPASLLGPSAPAGEAARAACQAAFMERLWTDSVGFAGAFMIRRIVGIAHVADLDSIADADVRAACERRALRLGRALLVGGAGAAGAASAEGLVQLAAKALAP